MSIEAALAELTAAVKANTEAHEKLAQVAKAAQGSKPAAAKKPAPEKAAPAEDTTEEAPAEEPKKAPAKKAPAKKAAAKKPDAPTLSATVEMDDFKNAARAFMSPDDEEQRDKNKANFAAALNHLGAASLSKVDGEDLPKLAGYVAYWATGLEVDFDEIDEKIAELSDGGDEEESDDMLD